MPIRFRCVYCNQLMGIARRKSGTVVKCPTCAGQVVVPGSDPERTERPRAGGDEAVAVAAAPAAAAAAGAAEGAAPAAAVFEQSDFGDVLREPEPVPMPAAPQPRVEAPPQPPVPVPVTDVERVDQSLTFNPAGVGLILSPARLALIIVIFILLLALAFGAGIVVGKNLAG